MGFNYYPFTWTRRKTPRGGGPPSPSTSRSEEMTTEQGISLPLLPRRPRISPDVHSTSLNHPPSCPYVVVLLVYYPPCTLAQQISKKTIHSPSSSFLASVGHV